jgi:hypothetical protein
LALVQGAEEGFPSNQTSGCSPSVQISLSNSFNQIDNALSITISPEETKEIEAQAAPQPDSHRSSRSFGF